jgi:hypothetical protein
VAVTITFQTPERTTPSSSLPPPSTHQRRLEAVPAPIARRIVDDWVAYCSLRARAATDPVAAPPDAVEAARQRLYRYQISDGPTDGDERGEEQIIALDFREVRSTVVSPP